MPKSNRILVIDKSVKILDYIVSHDNNCTLAEIASDLQIAKSTLFGILESLESNNLVHKDERTLCYSLGIKTFQYGKIFEQNFSLKQAVRPFEEELFQEFGECVHCAVEDNGKLLYIDMIESSHALRLAAQSGRHDPLYCTSMGKYILSTKSDEELEEYFRAVPLVPLTAHTITDPAALRQNLSQIRQSNLSLDIEELEIGLLCVSSGIYDSRGHLAAVLGISSPKTRIDSETFRKMGKSVLHICRKISNLL